ncbi:hypothetical protein PFISCL1PPCAC_10565, partial [Pristionchus fissidentatus]
FRMAVAQQLIITGAVKALILILVIIVLILLDPTYVTAYISINYEIVIIYIFSALTLLYCIVSVVMYCIMHRKDEGPSTNLSITEVIFATAGIMGWLIILGIGGTISQRTILETGEFFGWIGALAGIIVGCFLCIAGLFALNVINDKILSKDRQMKYSGSSRDGYAAGRSY